MFRLPRLMVFTPSLSKLPKIGVPVGSWPKLGRQIAYKSAASVSNLRRETIPFLKAVGLDCCSGRTHPMRLALLRTPARRDPAISYGLLYLEARNSFADIIGRQRAQSKFDNSRSKILTRPIYHSLTTAQKVSSWIRQCRVFFCLVKRTVEAAVLLSEHSREEKEKLACLFHN